VKVNNNSNNNSEFVDKDSKDDYNDDNQIDDECKNGIDGVIPRNWIEFNKSFFRVLSVA